MPCLSRKQGWLAAVRARNDKDYLVQPHGSHCGKAQENMPPMEGICGKRVYTDAKGSLFDEN